MDRIYTDPTFTRKYSIPISTGTSSFGGNIMSVHKDQKSCNRAIANTSQVSPQYSPHKLEQENYEKQLRIAIEQSLKEADEQKVKKQVEEDEKMSAHLQKQEYEEHLRIAIEQSLKEANDQKNKKQIEEDEQLSACLQNLEDTDNNVPPKCLSNQREVNKQEIKNQINNNEQWQTFFQESKEFENLFAPPEPPRATLVVLPHQNIQQSLHQHQQEHDNQLTFEDLLSVDPQGVDDGDYDECAKRALKNLGQNSVNKSVPTIIDDHPAQFLPYPTLPYDHSHY